MEVLEGGQTLPHSHLYERCFYREYSPDVGWLWYLVDTFEMPSIPESVRLLQCIVDLLILTAKVVRHMGHARENDIFLDDTNRLVRFDIAGVIPANMVSTTCAMVSWMPQCTKDMVNIRFQICRNLLWRRMNFIEFVNINFLVFVMM